MNIQFPCPTCQRMLDLPEIHRGKKARCPVCNGICTVPEAPSEPVPPSTPVENALNPTLLTATPTTSSRELPQSLPSDTPTPTPSSPPISPPTPAPQDRSGNWFLKTPEGQTYGPVSRDELDRWAAEGRVAADCEVRHETGPWQNARDMYPWMPPLVPVHRAQAANANASAPSTNASYATSVNPIRGTTYGTHVGQLAQHGPVAPTGPVQHAYRAPHRGALILILGLLPLVVPCPIFSFMAWVMGSHDMNEINGNRMDPTGKDLTQFGMVLGAIMSAVWILLILAAFGLLVLGALN